MIALVAPCEHEPRHPTRGDREGDDEHRQPDRPTGRERAGHGNEREREPDPGGDDRDRAGTAVERREHADRDDGGSEGGERAVPGRRDAAEREQALAGEQQSDGRDERCCPSGSRDESEPVHACSLNRSDAAAIGRADGLASFLRTICASTARHGRTDFVLNQH